jgi:hypothetical protein
MARSSKQYFSNRILFVRLLQQLPPHLPSLGARDK